MQEQQPLLCCANCCNCANSILDLVFFLPVAFVTLKLGKSVLQLTLSHFDSLLLNVSHFVPLCLTFSQPHTAGQLTSNPPAHFRSLSATFWKVSKSEQKWDEARGSVYNGR